MNKNVLNSKKKTPAKILIVEDEMIVAKDMQETLKSRGYAVTAIVNSGRDAIKQIKKEKPDLILMDIILKGKMDGIDTAMRIHDDFDIPVIFITAFANNSMLQRAKTVRPYAYITKPFESSELYINIEIALYKHKIQEELRHSEEKLKMLFEFAPDAYYLNDLKGSFVDGNKAAEELTGYTREELIGKNFLTLKLLPPTQIPKAATLLAKNVLGKPTGPDEFLLNRKDGTKVPVVIKTFPVKIHDRNLVLAIARDISEQKQTDKEREKVLSEMGKRIKELHCMYAITRSLGERKTLAEILKDVTVIVPCGYQYPEITRAKVYLDNREYIATSFAETKWKQTTDIVINSECRGRIEVYYLEQRPELDEGPFLKEERNLIDGTARLLNEVITRKQTEDKLIQLASWPEQNPNPAIEVNPSGTISYLNNAAQSHFPKLKNLSFQHPILKNLDSVVCDFKKKGERSILREVNVGNKTYEEKICYMPENKSIRIFAFEITEMKRTEKKLHDLSLIDQLTGLYNRRGFFTLAEQQIGLANRTKRGFYLLFADLDKMKWINDTFGHHEGDLVLKTIALLCKKSFRKSDIIGRLGGDEFAVCAIEAQKKSAQMLIRRLKQNLYEYNKKHDYKLSLSIGTTYYDPSNPCSIDELLEQADKLMYEQKMFKQSPRVTTIEPKEIALDKPSRTEYVLKSDIVKVLLIADDIQISHTVKEMIKEANTHRFEVVHVATLSTGLKHLGSEIVDVVLLDLNLKHRRQFEVFKKVYAQAQGVPIIVLIDRDTENLAVKAIREGAQDCLVKSQIDSNLLVRSIKYAIERGYTVLELKNSFGKFQKALEDTINTLAAIVEMRDPYTAGHQKRVSELAQTIAKEMNLTDEQTKGIKMAALIHDLGKIQVPEEILNKPKRLSDREMEIVQTHPSAGYEILRTIQFPWLITQIVHQHHERINGSGYPKGITSKDTLLESRILAVADVVEAMSSDRPYRPAPGLEKALEEITQNKSKLYDPDVVDTCIKLFKNKDFKFASGVNNDR